VLSEMVPLPFVRDQGKPSRLSTASPFTVAINKLASRLQSSSLCAMTALYIDSSLVHHSDCCFQLPVGRCKNCFNQKAHKQPLSVLYELAMELNKQSRCQRELWPVLYGITS
jgi:hypothetical protein